MHPFVFIPATLLLVIRAYRRQSLTPLGIGTAALTALIHGLHPSAIPFTLLVVFFLVGTSATKVKHDVKARLTLSSSGSGGGEGPRSAIQVLANSGAASILILAHVYIYGFHGDYKSSLPNHCFGNIVSFSEILLTGIIANYAAVTADTLSSELGILSKSRPRFIITFREVPPGTNGGITFTGLLAGFIGSLLIGTVAILFVPFCDQSLLFYDSKGSPIHQSDGKRTHVHLLQAKVTFVIAVAAWGTLGSLLDSFLGAVLQASVVDRRTGKVVEGSSGKRVKTSNSPVPLIREKDEKRSTEVNQIVSSRFINSGRDILDNNQINFLMASTMSISAMAGVVLWNRESV